jgi:hypothetical protein
MKIALLALTVLANEVVAFAPNGSVSKTSTTVLSNTRNNDNNVSSNKRRDLFASTFGIILGSTISTTNMASADPDGGFNVDDFLKSGQVSMPMGVSGQAGKSKPETGIVFRDGSELSRDSRSGDVFAEILLNARSNDPIAIITSFSSPWSLGNYYYVFIHD